MRYLRRPEVWVFLILFPSYAFFWQARDWNISSRLMLTYALVDRGTLSIDGLNEQTRDIARYKGHYYSDKTPGFSLLATGPYAVSKKLFKQPDHPLDRPGFAYWNADYWATLGTSGVLSALTGALLAYLAVGLGCRPRQAALVGLSYGLATPAFAYATLAYGHQVSAFCLLASFALLVDSRQSKWQPLMHAVAGFLAAYASVVEIQVGPVSAILGLFLLARVVQRQAKGWSVLTFGLGALVPTAILLTYNTLAFESPFRMGYFYEVLEEFSTVHSASNPLGIGRPDWSRASELLFGQRRGLLCFAPVLILAVPGLVALGIRRQWSTLVVATLTMTSVFLVNLSYPEWTGGWSTGPRLLLPLIPFAMLPIAALLASAGRWANWTTVLLSLVGAVEILMFVAIGARVPHEIERSFLDGVLPLCRGDRPLAPWTFGNRYASNLTTLIQPSLIKTLPAWAGWVTVLPLVLFQTLAIALMTRFIKSDAPLPSNPNVTDTVIRQS